MTQPLPGQLGFGPTPFGTDAEEMARRIRDLDQRMSALATSLTLAINTTAGAVYPVGSIYLSVNNTNPASLFGGTWVAWGTGRVPVAVDTGQTEFNTVEKTGGEKTHVLTDAELPAHNYVIHPAGATTYYFNQGTSTTDRADQLVGGGTGHNNLQPYITCYMFKRTA